jgi:hypothetical protein
MNPELSNSGVPQSQVEALAQLYISAAQKIKELVLHPKGVSAQSQAWSQARASVLMAQVDREVQTLMKGAAEWIGPNVRQAMLDGVARGNSQLKGINVLPEGAPLGGSLALLDQGTMRQFAMDTYRDLHKAAESMGKNAKTALRKTAQTNLSEAEVNRILAGGVVSGMPRQTQRELQAALDPTASGKVTIINKNGDPMDFDAGDYARMVARTKTREATVAARHERLQQEGIDLVSIVGKISVNFCTAYLGMVFSISGKSDKYPSLEDLPSGGPPFHPNCSKSTRPFVEDLATDEELDEADGVDDADKLLDVDAATAQRRFKDLQLYSRVKDSYATTERKLFRK